MMPKNIQKQIDNVIVNFDFDKVHKVMQFLDWQWVTDIDDFVNSREVPSISKLVLTARKLLCDVYENAIKSKGMREISSGGFKVICDTDGKKFNFVLEFNLVNWNDYNL